MIIALPVTSPLRWHREQAALPGQDDARDNASIRSARRRDIPPAGDHGAVARSAIGVRMGSCAGFRLDRPYTIEEAYEVADAISGDLAALREELGDLLLRWCSTAAWPRKPAFAFDDVAAAIADKMEDRHPHIFGVARMTRASRARSAGKIARRPSGRQGRTERAGRGGARPARTDARGKAPEARRASASIGLTPPGRPPR
jgi:NTP pyrophosphatase (non-canonical NTP hydrolase)